MEENTGLFSRRPGKDFSRNSKLTLQKTVSILLAMQGKSISNELLDFFDFDPNTPSASAFVQARNKLAPNAIQTLFQRFVRECDVHGTYKGFRLLAADGSEFPIPQNKNTLHLNAIYDIQNNIYVDGIVENVKNCDEQSALNQMIDRSEIQSAIILADRGYEAYNTLAHAQEKGWKFLFRVKDGISGIVSGLDIPKTEEFDKKFDVKLTFHQNKIFRDDKNVKRLNPKHKFDFLTQIKTKNMPIEFFNLSFRVVRFKISDKTIETLITNLDQENFDADEIKKLYNMRWGIETSFRDMKYTLNALKFHSKQLEYARHEIFARLIMYNFFMLITSSTKIEDRQCKHTCKVNFSVAVKIIRRYFLDKLDLFEAEVLMEKFILPIRKGRKNPRKFLPKRKTCFTYR